MYNKRQRRSLYNDKKVKTLEDETIMNGLVPKNKTDGTESRNNPSCMLVVSTFLNERPSLVPARKPFPTATTIVSSFWCPHSSHPRGPREGHDSLLLLLISPFGSTEFSLCIPEM